MFLYTCHFPKTGGTSILYYIRESNNLNKIFRIGKASIKRLNMDFIDFCLTENISDFNLNSFAHVSGHLNNSRLLTFLKYDPNNFKTYLIIRDPVSLFWSKFYQNKFNGKNDITPEIFLKESGKKKALEFYKDKFSSLLGEPKEFIIADFLKLFNFVFETKNISNVMGKIDPSLLEISLAKRRVRNNMKDFTPDPLQSDKSFNKDVSNFLSIDNKFYQDCKKVINDDLYTNNAFDQNFLKESIDQLKINHPKLKVQEYFKYEVLKNFLRKNSLSFSVGKVKKWDNIFDNYGISYNDFIN